MASVHKSVLVPYSAAQMFVLVERSDDYPRFLPWCAGAQAIERDGERVVVRIDIDFHGVRAHFTTANQNRPSEQIVMHLRDGPFRRLEGTWKFHQLAAQACKVEFDLEYEFSSAALARVVGPVFNYIADSFIDAFVRRAEVVYGA
ncbi:MAG: type II toxin-antitoxin system RatA family toxin [Casimicrobiaceae bacterium]